MVAKEAKVAEPQVFRYEMPEMRSSAATVWLCRSEILSGAIRVLKEGGETNLHAHPANEGFWLVLSGRVRFYGEGDELIADLGKYEGILVPHGYKYWLEKGEGDEPLEILRVGAKVAGLKDEMVNYSPQTAGNSESRHVPATAPERGARVPVGEPPPGWLRPQDA